MKEIAIFGGAFDPPTKAHEGIMAACLERADIDEVWLMPSGQRPDKPQLSTDVARLAMLQLVKDAVFANEPRLLVTDFEQQLGQPNETRRTTAALRAAHPDTNFWYVFGADTYHRMLNWEGGAELRQKIGMLVVARPGHELPDESAKVRHLDVPPLHGDISSTAFREALQAARPLGGFVSQAVLQYIEDQGLYGASPVTPVRI